MITILHILSLNQSGLYLVYRACFYSSGMSDPQGIYMNKAFIDNMDAV